MFYIYQTACISPQHSFEQVELENVVKSVDNKLYVIEPKYQGIPPGTLRRMGKAVRIGVGAALPLVQANPDLNGVIIGTANGGLEDCIKFLNQIIQYDEGTLTPTNFVQSTANAVAAQIGMYGSNKGYNITHVHRGHAFENALLDSDMLLKENPYNKYLLGGVEEISDYNYNIQLLGGWYKKEVISNSELYNFDNEGSIAGEGAAMFIVGAKKKDAQVKVEKFKLVHSPEAKDVEALLSSLIEKDDHVDLLLSGENGDKRSLHFYEKVEKLSKTPVVARFKHLTGEHQSTTSIALWLACHIFKTQSIPEHMIKAGKRNWDLNRILIYNNYEGYQHSFILLSKV